MPKQTTQNFIQGSLIILTANILVKIIGAIFKIPLFHLLGADGMAYFNSAYTIYSGLFIIATAGLPVALSKMISESSSQGNYKEVKRIFRVSFYIFASVGLTGGLVLYFFAGPLVNMMKYNSPEGCIIALAPALLFVSLMSVYRGFFQGLRNMIPTAVSEVVEASGKLILGYTFAYFLISKGLDVAATGAVAGVSIGTFLGFISLIIMYKFYKKSIYPVDESYKNMPARSTRQLARSLIGIAVPITISASVFTITNLIDTALIGMRLDSIKDFLANAPATLYGNYTGQAVTMFNMPPTLVMALAMTLVPTIARAYISRERETVRVTTEQALKLTVLFAMPAAIGLAVLSKPILQLLFGGANTLKSNLDMSLLLTMLSPSVLFVCLVLVSNAILQATGNVIAPVKNIAIGGVVKIILNYTLVSVPWININGAPIGTDVCYLIYMVLNLRLVLKVTGADMGIVQFWIKPFIASASMGISALFLFNTVAGYMLRYGKFGTATALVVGIGGGAVIYLLMLLAIGGIKQQDIDLLPGGKKLYKKLKSYNLIR